MRVPLTVRILRGTDERLTAAVEATGRSPQYLVDEALARYLDSLGI
jgi:predicted DNA-binding protein